MTRRRFFMLGLLLFVPAPVHEVKHSPEYWRWLRSRSGV